MGDTSLTVRTVRRRNWYVSSWEAADEGHKSSTVHVVRIITGFQRYTTQFTPSMERPYGTLGCLKYQYAQFWTAYGTRKYYFDCIRYIGSTNKYQWLIINNVSLRYTLNLSQSSHSLTWRLKDLAKLVSDDYDALHVDPATVYTFEVKIPMDLRQLSKSLNWMRAV